MSDRIFTMPPDILLLKRGACSLNLGIFLWIMELEAYANVHYGTLKSSL